jgi:hypothetical protein
LMKHLSGQTGGVIYSSGVCGWKTYGRSENLVLVAGFLLLRIWEDVDMILEPVLYNISFFVENWVWN